MSKYIYETCCVNSTAEKIHAMVDVARTVTLSTLRRHIAGLDDWAIGMSYSVGAERGLHLKDDWAVTFHKSVYCGEPCYYIDHSAIEHIFTKSIFAS
jgi:hypothetical protein